jgi:hypothetical protein
MLYLATASGPKVRDAMARGLLGQMVTYKSGNLLEPGATFAVDNGIVTRGPDGRPATDPRWNPARWQDSLDRHQDTPGCLFAAVPDAVADTDETDRRWRRWAPAVTRRGYQPAYVAQDGCRGIPDAAVVFLGGSDEFKLGAEGRRVIAAAHAAGLPVHCGRVNTRARLREAAMYGCDTVDGTTLAFGPDRNLPQLLRWLYPAQPSLFGGVA